MPQLSGASVTIDAMGCQTEIASAIVQAGADYVLAVQGNQPTLHNGLVLFADHQADDFARVTETSYYFWRRETARRD